MIGRARLPAVGVGVTMLALGLAGCLGGDGDGLAAGADVPEAGDFTAYISGLVMDTEFFPLDAARVGAKGPDIETRTDSNGSFTLGPLPGQGQVELYADKDGYSGVLRTLTIGTDPLDRVVFILEAVGSKTPYHETIPHVAFIECAWAVTPALGTSPCNVVDRNLGTELTVDNSQWFFEIPGPGLETLLMEAFWSGQAMGRDMRFILLVPDVVESNYLTGDPMLDGRGGSPYQTWLYPGKVGDGGSQAFAGNESTPYQILYRPWVTNSTTGFAAVYINHRVDSFWTFFYYREASKDFTALPDE